MRIMNPHHFRNAVLCCITFILLLSCAPGQIPRRGSLSELPTHPDAQILQDVPEDIVPFVTTTTRWLGPACRGIWGSYVIPASTMEVGQWYQSAMRMRGWLRAGDIVPAQEPRTETWYAWYREEDKRTAVTTLFLNPLGMTVAPAEAPAKNGSVESMETYTYVLALTCPIYAHAVRPYAR